MNSSTSNWYRLDNAAKIFPEVYNKKEPHTFRVQISLKQEIDPIILQQAVDKILIRFPMFKVKLKKGLFWSYLEENEKSLKIQKMSHLVNSYMDFKANNNYLLKIFYHDKTIAVEVFHTLTDGTGLTEFIKSLTYEYLKKQGHDVTPDNIILTTTEQSINDESEDSSKTYYNKKNNERQDELPPFKITGTHTEDFQFNLITGIISTQEAIRLAKSKHVTLTQYLTALTIYTIYKTKVQYRNQTMKTQNPIKIGVPVNLRSRFPSKTMRNFVNIVSICADVSNDDMTLDDILQVVQKEFTEKTTNEELTRMMSEYVSYEKKLYIRLVPQFIKSYFMKIGYSRLGSSLFTLSLSNLGRVQFPESMDPYINDMTFMVGASRNNNINCAIVSFNDTLKISFTSNILEHNIQREFFRHFTSLGIPVEIESNYLEVQHENM